MHKNCVIIDMVSVMGVTFIEVDTNIGAVEV